MAKFTKGNFFSPNGSGKSIKKITGDVRAVFGQYLPADAAPILVSWSVLRDSPRYLSDHILNVRVPLSLDHRAAVAPEDIDYFLYGSSALNEYATNYATKYLLDKKRLSILKPVNLLDKGIDILALNTGIAPRRVLRQIKQVCKGGVFDDAIFSAFFSHDFEKFDKLIYRANIRKDGTRDRVKNWQDLAVEIGKKTLSGRLTKMDRRSRSSEDDDPTEDKNDWLFALNEANDEFSTIERRWKRIPLLVNGEARVIGVAQIYGIPIALFALLNHRTPFDLLLGWELLHYTAVHESLHVASAGANEAGENFMGFLPIDILSNKSMRDQSTGTSFARRDPL